MRFLRRFVVAKVKFIAELPIFSETANTSRKPPLKNLLKQMEPP